MADTNTRLLDTIDLTGDEPVITTKIIKEVYIDLSDDEDDDNGDGEENDENEPPVKKVRVTSKKCEVCCEEVSKYTCPCCTMRTCSLDCVLEHKQRTGCSGQRNKTSFVPRTEFNNIHLLNDYRLLEEAGRIADNARRDVKSKIPWTEKRVSIMQNNVGRSGVTWYCMEKGMQRHRENKSRYDYREKFIEWSVKVVFVDVLKEVTEFCSETKTLQDIIAYYIDTDKVLPENKITFAAYIEHDGDVTVFFRNEFDAGDNLRYTEVSRTETLRECLYQKSVLEYPEFHVVLDKDVSKQMASEEFVKEKDTSTRLAPLDNWLTT